MKVIVTGGLGHIGSSLIRQLPKEFNNPEIVIVDNMLTQRYSSLFNLPQGNYRFLEKDIFDESLKVEFENADYVVHLAAITDAAGSIDRQEEVEKTNFEGTKHIAELCRATNCSLINLSTTSVYGTNESQVDENCTEEELQPQSPYAKSKMKAENYLKEMPDDLKYITLRFGTIVGVSEGMRFHTAINKFCWQASMGLPITVWKTALHQVRPYLDLQDGVTALCHIIKNDIFDREIYNVLTDNVTVNDIVEMIKIRIPVLEITMVESRIMNQLSYHVLNDKFAKTGFKSTGDIKEAILKELEIFKTFYHDRNI